MPVRRRRRRGAASSCPRSPPSSTTATCPGCSPVSATASGCTARGSPSRGCGPTRPSCCSTPTPRRSRARCEWNDAVFDFTADDGPDGAPDRPTARRSCPGRSSSTRSSTGATTATRASPGTRRSSTRPTSGPHHAPPRRARGAARHLLRPGQPSRSSTTSSASGVTAVELMPVHQFIHDRRLRRARPAQLLGLQLDRLPRAAQRLRQLRPAGPAGAGVQADGEDPARRGHRGDPRRRLQPHRRGQRPGPGAVVQGHRQPGLLPPRPRRPAPLRRLHRHRQQPQHAPPARAAADHGQPALLGERDARRRLPLRPGRHPGPRAARRRQALGVLRPHPAGPGRQPGEAHRRAVGRRRGRLPGRQLPAAVVGVERQVPRRGPRLLAGRRPHRGRVRLPLHRQLRPLRVHRAHAVGQHQLRHRPRRLHPRRPRLLRRQAQRGQRRGQPRRHRRQPLVELRRRGPDRRRRGRRPAPAPAAQPARHPAALPGRADAARRRRDRPHPARQQQRLRPGQRDLLVRLGRGRRRPARVHPPADGRCAASTRCSGAASGSRAARSWASGPTTSSGSPPRAPP